MQITLGKHQGKSLELVALKDPSYIRWLLREDAKGRLRDLQLYTRALLDHFDKMPIQHKCFAPKCSAKATCFSVYRDNIAPIWWCDECDPYQLGALPGRLQILSTYACALSHALLHCTKSADAEKTLVTSLARAKGLPQRVAEAQAAKFFA